MSNYCRLCAEFKDSSEIITSISDQEKCIEEKLIACCEWNAEDTENLLPQSICELCFEKLEQCWLFSQSVQQAQHKLQEVFGEIWCYICLVNISIFRVFNSGFLSILYRECGGSQASGVQKQTYV